MTIKHRLSRICKALNVFLLAGAILASGCAEMKIAKPEMDHKYYPLCYQPFVDLEASRDALIKRALIGTAIGTVGGAVTGAIISANLKGALSGVVGGAVVGGVAGAVIGGIAGYASGKMDEIELDEDRMRSYQADMNADMRNASRVEQYALASMQCYTKEFDSLIMRFRKGQLPEEEVRERYNEIKTGMEYISSILHNSKEQLIKNDTEYRAAFEAEAQAKKIRTPKIASLEKKRAQAAKKQNIKKKPKFSKRQKRYLRREGRLELNEITAELGEKQKQAAIRTERLEKEEEKQAEIAKNNQGPKEIEEVSKYYDKQYLDGVVRLEDVEEMNARSLSAMSKAARNAGIDKV